MPRFIRKTIERLERIQRRTFRKVEKFFSAIVRPFERAGRKVSRKAMVGADSLDRVGRQFAKLGDLVTWPLRSAWKGLAHLWEIVLPASVRSAISKPFRGIAKMCRQVGRGVVKLGLALNLDRVILPIVRFTRPVWRPVWNLLKSISGFLAAWSMTRRYKRLLWALPAILLFIPIGAVTGRGYLNRGKTAQHYHAARQQAQDEKDYPRVQFYERKLAQLGVDNDRREYRFALERAEDGQLADAYERMQNLAPQDEPGLPEAHYWIVRQLIAEEIDVDDQQQLELLGVHLDHLDTLGIDVPILKYYRAIWHYRNDRAAEAADVLKPIIDEFVEAASLRLYLNKQLQRDADAREDALAVRRHMELRSPGSAALRPQDYEVWKSAEVFLGDDARVRDVLNRWAVADPDNNEVRNEIAEIRRRQVERTMQQGRTNANRLTRMLTDAADASTDPRKMLPHVGMLFRQRDVNPLAASVIEQLLSAKETPASFLEAMGTLAAVDGDWQLGRELIGRALDKDPENAIAWNNWAWMLISQPEGDLDEAYAAVQKALAISPGNFYFRETRGQILFRLGKLPEAVADLEYAANGLPDTPEIHESLASAYQTLGNAELAAVHRQQVP